MDEIDKSFEREKKDEINHLDINNKYIRKDSWI